MSQHAWDFCACIISHSPLPFFAQRTPPFPSVPGAVSALDALVRDSWAAAQAAVRFFPEDDGLVYFLLTPRNPGLSTSTARR